MAIYIEHNRAKETEKNTIMQVARVVFVKSVLISYNNSSTFLLNTSFIIMLVNFCSIMPDIMIEHKIKYRVVKDQ